MSDRATGTREVLTDCTLCYHSCGTRVTVTDGKAVKVEGLESHPINHGKLCPKGEAALDAVYNPDRIKTPLKRVGDKFEPISWDQALGEIAEKLNQLKRDHGP
ncbi:MAG: molybdopterin-dependent oxidoreductase, partial [Deltaproteobacteria bacterium]|nr:molybdopterin-dependent oxidoreductase [Deltaproteobacteria bacterium]